MADDRTTCNVIAMVQIRNMRVLSMRGHFEFKAFEGRDIFCEGERFILEPMVYIF